MALAVVVTASACAAEVNRNVESESDVDSVSKSELGNAWVACYEDKGVDAQVIDAGVLFDKNGTLGAKESVALAQQCEAELQSAGLLAVSDLDSGGREAQYNQFVQLRDCVVAAGFDVPEMVSLDVYTADPSQLIHPLTSLQATQNLDIVERVRRQCLAD